jgi:hypothetical protein
VVPPVGSSAHLAFRELAAGDPDGNLVFLRQRGS